MAGTELFPDAPAAPPLRGRTSPSPGRRARTGVVAILAVTAVVLLGRAMFASDDGPATPLRFTPPTSVLSDASPDSIPPGVAPSGTGAAATTPTAPAGTPSEVQPGGRFATTAPAPGGGGATGSSPASAPAPTAPTVTRGSGLDGGVNTVR